jgi:hypothetical protein
VRGASGGEGVGLRCLAVGKGGVIKRTLRQGRPRISALTKRRHRLLLRREGRRHGIEIPLRMKRNFPHPRRRRIPILSRETRHHCSIIAQILPVRSTEIGVDFFATRWGGRCRARTAFGLFPAVFVAEFGGDLPFHSLARFIGAARDFLEGFV